MKNIPDEILWVFLLDLKEYVRVNFRKIEDLFFIFRNGEFENIHHELPELSTHDRVIALSVNKKLKFSVKSTVFQMEEDNLFRLVSNDFLDSKGLEFILLYLPLCLLPIKSYKLNRTVTLLHFAQSLDGKIATTKGHSKWIGNHENLVHSHRLRALFDGILIGSKTLATDKPRLNVRHVTGRDPLKIVVGNIHTDVDCLLENKGKVLFITSQDDHPVKGIETIVLPGKTGLIDPETILDVLYSKGIQSLFIEGGAYTASSFLSAKSIDLLEIFISPRILGSGIACFSLKEITNIDESITFSASYYTPMGNGILFSGVVNY